jgi:hypothetical protein
MANPPTSEGVNFLEIRCSWFKITKLDLVFTAFSYPMNGIDIIFVSKENRFAGVTYLLRSRSSSHGWHSETMQM